VIERERDIDEHEEASPEFGDRNWGAAKRASTRGSGLSGRGSP
jgi:hypothetical protein